MKTWNEFISRPNSTYSGRVLICQKDYEQIQNEAGLAAMEKAVAVVRANSIPIVGGGKTTHLQRRAAIDSVGKTFRELLAAAENYRNKRTYEQMVKDTIRNQENDNP
jgi:hypothetical protein